MMVPKPTRKRRDFKRPAVKEFCPLELTEQQTILDWLTAHKILHTGISVDRKSCRLYGYRAGLCDILIFDRPLILRENNSQPAGVGIEVKRVKGGVVSPEQKYWHEQLRNRGWLVFVAYGADSAIKFLEKVYGKTVR